MKKLALLLAIVLSLTTVLGACGGTADTPQTTEAPKNIMQKSDPAEDDTMNILMVGNSFCFYFTDELYGMLTQAGIKAKVYNVYYSGCKLEQHWTWWKNREANYDLICNDERGRTKMEGVDLLTCLSAENWDVITLQEGSSKMRRGDPATELAASKLYRQELYGLFSEQFPKTALYWQQTWAYQVGFNRDGYVVDAAEQAAYHERQRTYALGVCEENGVTRIPSGDAWKIVRDGGYDNLCARLAKDNGLGDFYHDGDIGGGQYLNACVWFEVLTGQSCVGNAFRPDYELSEDLITTFQNAAHQAVENMKNQ